MICSFKIRMINKISLRIIKNKKMMISEKNMVTNGDNYLVDTDIET